MKIKNISDVEFIIYIKKEYMEFKEEIEEMIEDIFEVLNKYYGIKNNGYFKINLYKDSNYGMILECLTTKEKYYSYKLNIDLEINEVEILIKTDEGLIKPNKISDYELGELFYKVD